MEIICESCQGRLQLPDDKISPGKTVSVICPRCKAKLTVTAPEDKSSVMEAAFDNLFDFNDDESEGYDASDKPFDFIEDEGKTALICEIDPLLREKVRPTLDILEYHVTEAPNGREALKKMRYHNYDLIVLNEYFDTQDPDANPVLIYLERQEMETRRNIFLTLLTQRFRTMDHMVAFQKSVNMIVNIRNIDDFDKILQRGMADYGLFYKAFKESLSD